MPFTLDDALLQVEAEWNAIADLRREAKDREDGPLLAVATQARAMGATWEQIGGILQVSRQAAQQRFGGYSYNFRTGQAELVAAKPTGPSHAACPRRCGGMGERVDAIHYVCNECGEAFTLPRFDTKLTAPRPVPVAGLLRGCPRCHREMDGNGTILVCEGCGLTTLDETER